MGARLCCRHSLLQFALLWLVSPALGDKPSHLVLPLKRRDGGLIARGLLRNATLPLHGAVKDYGYFYATLQLGTPSRTFAVIVDTGSTITYVPCSSCGHNCGSHHKDAAFDPAASATSQTVACSSEQCLCGRPACGCSENQECLYSRTYAEQSSSSGLLISDQLNLSDGGVDIVFGCETKETGEIYNQEADGILGLGNSEVSLVNQLSGRGVIDDVFALCFGSVEGDGALMLGEVPHNVELQYTELLTSQAHPHYYLVRLDSIAVGNEDLDVPAGKYEEGYGTVLDSGTTFTYLPSEAFGAFRDKVTAFATAKGLHSVKGPDPKFHDICFGGAPHVDHPDQLSSVFPSLQLNFAQGVHLPVGPLNYLFMHTGEPGAYCLGVFDNGHSGTLLGGITFRNILVQYDRQNRRVGFGNAHCQQMGLGFHCSDRSRVQAPECESYISEASQQGGASSPLTWLSSVSDYVHQPWPDWVRGTVAAAAVVAVAAVAFAVYTTRSRWLPKSWQASRLQSRESECDEEGRQQLVDIHTRSPSAPVHASDQFSGPVSGPRGSGLSVSTPVSLQDESPPGRKESGFSEAGSRSSMQHRPTRSGSLAATPNSLVGSDKSFHP